MDIELLRAFFQQVKGLARVVLEIYFFAMVAYVIFIMWLLLAAFLHRGRRALEGEL